MRAGPKSSGDNQRSSQKFLGKCFNCCKAGQKKENSKECHGSSARAKQLLYKNESLDLVLSTVSKTVCTDAKKCEHFGLY